MVEKVEQVVQSILSTPYHRNTPFLEERARYLGHLLAGGWSLNTVRGRSIELSAFARRVDILARPSIRVETIEATAAPCISRAARQKPFVRAVGRHKARCRFVHAVTDWLRFLGRLEEKRVESPGRYAEFVEEFTEYLRNERGLADATIDIRRTHILAFLVWFDEVRGDLSEASLGDIETFLASKQARRWNRVTVGIFITSLRAFFYYARRKGWCHRIFADAIERPRQYAAEGLPSGPSWRDVQRLLASVGNERPVDIRDRAILMLAAIYGFRSHEIRQLQLEDVQWARDLITIHRPKQRRDQQYPLVPVVGEALVRYLRHARPQSDRREVFLRVLAPFDPLTAGGLGALVHQRLRRLHLDLPHYGPHVLRHACARHLLAEGFSLKEIGDHLGHRDPRSTRIYAKVDLAGLRAVGDVDLGELL
jgi:integrase/recombinase XerD